MKMVKIAKGQKLAAPFNGLRIDLDEDDIKECERIHKEVCNDQRN